MADEQTGAYIPRIVDQRLDDLLSGLPAPSERPTHSGAGRGQTSVDL